MSRHKLEHHFREQQRFADGYSPLYSQLFGILAGRLAGDRADPVVDWLVAASAGRRPFDVTLLLPAALHRDVLAGEPAVADLRRFYPTAWTSDEFGVTSDELRGVPRRASTNEARADDELESALREAILARQDALAGFIRRTTVQTNETGRGLAWLLPVACLGWPEVHLVELGASAGLNLVAERRAYRLVDAAEPSRVLLDLGDGPRPQFSTLVGARLRARPVAESRHAGAEGRHAGLPLRIPTILSRAGGDVAPFHLRTAEDELTMASFVWGDQPQRLERLREGIAALRDAQATAAPARLLPLRLPDGLPDFLERELPRPLDAPAVLFNTVITMYLPERGAALRQMVGDWAVKQDAPVLWLQWEPAWEGPEPPEKYWMAWTADYWPNNEADEYRRYHLAWVHPHGGALQWQPDWAEFLRKAMQN